MDRWFVPLSISPSKFQIVAFIWTSKPTICQSDCFPWLIWGRDAPFVAGVSVSPWMYHGAMSPFFSLEFLYLRVVLTLRQWRRSRGTSSSMADLHGLLRLCQDRNRKCAKIAIFPRAPQTALQILFTISAPFPVVWKKENISHLEANKHLLLRITTG